MINALLLQNKSISQLSLPLIIDQYNEQKETSWRMRSYHATGVLKSDATLYFQKSSNKGTFFATAVTVLEFESYDAFKSGVSFNASFYRGIKDPVSHDNIQLSIAVPDIYTDQQIKSLSKDAVIIIDSVVQEYSQEKLLEIETKLNEFINEASSNIQHYSANCNTYEEQINKYKNIQFLDLSTQERVTHLNELDVISQAIKITLNDLEKLDSTILFCSNSTLKDFYKAKITGFENLSVKVNEYEKKYSILLHSVNKLHDLSYKINESVNRYKAQIETMPKDDQEALWIGYNFLLKKECTTIWDNAKEATNSIASSETDIDVLFPEMKSLDKNAYEAVKNILADDLAKQPQRERQIETLGNRFQEKYFQIKKDNYWNNELKNYSHGINVKIWNGSLKSQWAQTFFNLPDSILYFCILNKNDIFSPNLIDSKLFKNTITSCYQGYLYIPSTGSHKFVLSHPSVPANWSCGDFALYIDDKECVNLISESHNSSSKKDIIFDFTQEQGLHKFLFINEINWKCPDASKIVIKAKWAERNEYQLLNVEGLYLHNQDIINHQQREEERKKLLAKQKEEYEQRFHDILKTAPLKVDISFFEAADVFPMKTQGIALTVESRIRGNTRNAVGALVDIAGQLATSNKVKQVPYTIDLAPVFMKTYDSTHRKIFSCPIMYSTIKKSDLRRYISSIQNDQSAFLHKKIFESDLSNDLIKKKLDELEDNIKSYNICRYHISGTILSYKETHVLTAEKQNKIEFAINTAMTVEVCITDLLTSQSKKIRIPLTTKTDGIMPYNTTYSSTAELGLNRVNVFKISSEFLAERIEEEIMSMQRTQ